MANIVNNIIKNHQLCEKYSNEVMPINIEDIKRLLFGRKTLISVKRFRERTSMPSQRLQNAGFAIHKRWWRMAHQCNGWTLAPYFTAVQVCAHARNFKLSLLIAP